MSRQRNSRGGFTLVELLVVIGIIAVLIAILLPSLNKARQQAAKVKCLSNLHQMHLALMTYAMNNKDYIPIGYVRGLKQMNYLIYDPTPNAYVNFGYLWKSGAVKNEQVMYCPSRFDVENEYSVPDNPWPPNSVPGMYTRAGYSCRPVVDWGVTNGDKIVFPKLMKMKSKAILSDVVADETRLVTCHKTGVNVLYGHGGAVWVPQSVFWKDLQSCPHVFIPSANDFMLKTDPTGTEPYQKEISGVWVDFDYGEAVTQGTNQPPAR